MKKHIFLFILVLLPMLASAETVSDVQVSGCQHLTLEERNQSLPTIVLTKEGSVLSVQLLNYESYTATTDFNMTSSINVGEPYSVTINVNPVIPDGVGIILEWVCLLNVSFTIRDLEPNSFYLDCWWYKGLVELTEGEPLVLEYKVENANIGDMSFRLLKVMHKAMLMDWVTAEEELHIPSEVTYEGETYAVTSISKDAFWNTENATKITVPKTIRSMDRDNDAAIYANPFRECKSLEWIEVEEGCPLFSSVDGVLFAENKTMLLGYPIASHRKTYTVPEGVTYIRSGAFVHNKYLRKLIIPEEVTFLGWHLFSDTNSLEAVYIKGVIEPECMNTLFGDMDTKVVVYVKPSEVEKFKAVYNGPVYPLPEQIDDDLDYRPFVEEGKVWKVGNTQTIVNNSVQVVDYYYFDGDTIIDGRTCKQMMCQRFVSPDYSNEYWTPKNSLTKVGAWYEDDQKVYFYNLQKEKDYWRIKYDFSLEANDTLQFLNVDGYPPFIIGPKQTGGLEGFKGVYRDIRMCGDEGQHFHSTFWLEGVGDINGPTRYPIDPILDDPVPEFLMSCVVGDEVIYYNDEYVDGATPAGARKNRFDFTHTNKLKPKTRVRSEEEPSLYGEYNDKQLDINLGLLDDAYQVCITDGSGKAVYEKVINAGNIVALNIDISDYAKDHYTVTVENSRESFSGEFETLTDGISDAVRLNDKRKIINDKRIYNLQGQRLSRLQKGLNIVNGKKIYVRN